MSENRLSEVFGGVSIWRILIVYVGGSYALIEAVDLFEERFGLPGWVFTATVVLLAVGLPVVLATAYFQHRPSAEGASDPRPRSGAASVFTWKNAIAAGVLAFAVLGVITTLQSLTGAVGQGAAVDRAARLVRLDSLIFEERYAAAWSLVRAMGDDPSNDPELARRLDEFTVVGSMNTDPEGATVFRRPWDGTEADWEVVGTTPLVDVRGPDQVERYRIELDGYETRDQLLNWSRIGGRTMRLHESGTMPDGMIGPAFPPGRFRLVMAGLNHLPPVELGTFMLGEHEVTNGEYKRFVEAGGYDDPQWWVEPFTEDGVSLAFEDAIGRFTDQTGRSGPATWLGGTYADGEGDHPVAGISWYEAAAYARFAGGALPSVYHWNFTAQPTLASRIIPLSNMGGRGLLPVGETEAVSLLGHKDMAGNVREWVQNAVQNSDDRFILGGGFNDPAYLFHLSYSQSAWDRSETNGMRLAMYPEGPPVAQAVADLPLPRRDYAAERPVSDEVFAVFRRMYDYDPRPLEPELVSSHETEHWIRERWLINGAEDGDRIPVSVYLPLGRAGPHQTVVHFPGASSIGNRRPESGYVGRLQYIIESGRALVVPLVEGVWDREGELTTYVPDETVTYRDRVVDWSKTFSRAVDFIESRDDLDETALGYYGYSWGGMMSSVMLANEPRFKVAVLDVGGLPTHPSLPEVDPLNFAPRVTIPVLMMNGRHDHTFPLESSGRPLYERLGAPPESKRLVISETGHFVPVAQQIRESLDWLDLHLGPAD